MVDVGPLYARPVAVGLCVVDRQREPSLVGNQGLHHFVDQPSGDVVRLLAGRRDGFVAGPEVVTAVVPVGRAFAYPGRSGRSGSQSGRAQAVDAAPAGQAAVRSVGNESPSIALGSKGVGNVLDTLAAHESATKIAKGTSGGGEVNGFPACISVL